MTNNNYDLAYSTFLKVFPSKADKIKTIKDIHSGYTNNSYLFILDDGTKYQVRIPHPLELIDRKVEYKTLELTGNDIFKYFDQKTGIAIKKWIEGKNPKRRVYKSDYFNNLLFKKIKKIHQVKVTSSLKVTPINFGKYNEYLPYLKFEYQKKYLCLLDRRRNETVVLTHSDINPLNVIYDGKKVHIIDFEWCCLASPYWDYANWIRETNLNIDKIDWNKYIPNFDKEKLSDFIFLSAVFAHLWTYVMPRTPKMKRYRKKTLKQIRRAYKYVIHHEKIYYN